MNAIPAALLGALKSLLTPRMLVLMLLPMCIALLLWGGLAAWFWEGWKLALQAWLASQGAWLPDWALNLLLGYGVIVLLILLLLPAVYVTALVITSVFAMPVMLRAVSARDFPELARLRGGGNTGSALNAVFAIAVYVALWLVTLPLWLLGPLAAIVPVLLNAWLNQRLFRYDALAEHASRAEYATLVDREQGPLLMLGGILGLIHLVPVLNLFAPVYMGLAFIHFGLDRLDALRAGESSA
jgi:uncharacterized protein involved in cysteine biosynthesis